MAENGVVTAYGTVMHDRVVYNARKGWFSGRSNETISMRHVTSVRIETSRHVVWGVIFGLIGLFVLTGAPTAAKIIGLIPLALAVLLLWGSPRVVLNTAGGDLRPSIGFPWTRPEAERFVTALRRVLFPDMAP
jgi:hypothetical protein